MNSKNQKSISINGEVYARLATFCERERIKKRQLVELLTRDIGTDQPRYTRDSQ